MTHNPCHPYILWVSGTPHRVCCARHWWTEPTPARARRVPPAGTK